MTTGLHPFDESGIVAAMTGCPLSGLATSLVECCARPSTIARAEAIVEVAGTHHYRDSGIAARSPADLRSAASRGDRVAIRLGNGLDWCLAFFGIQLAGAIAVPVNTRFSEAEVEYVINDSGSKFVFMPGAAAARRLRTLSLRRSRAPGRRRHLLHQRHHRLPQRRDDHARGFSLEHRNLPPHRPAALRRQHPDAGLGAAVPRTGCNSQLLPSAPAAAPPSSCPRSTCRPSSNADWRRADQFADLRAGRLLAGDQSAKFLAKSILAACAG